MRRILRKHLVRWGGIYRMLKRLRTLRRHVLKSLTGSVDGAHHAVPMIDGGDPQEEGGELDVDGGLESMTMDDGDISEEEEEEEEDEPGNGEDEDDLDLAEMNQAAGKPYPLEHRCLSPQEWKEDRQLKSLLTSPYEMSKGMQEHGECGLDTAYILNRTLHKELTQDAVEIVCEGDGVEEWELIHAYELPRPMQ